MSPRTARLLPGEYVALAPLRAYADPMWDLLITAGNLVIQVLNTGKLRAYTADKGEKLLDIDTPARNGMGPPITFMLDGKQYIALNGGLGQVAGGGRGGPAGQRAARACLPLIFP